MQLKKQLTAILLAIVLLVAAIPTAALVAMAADINSDDLVWGNSQGITRAQWLHNLVVVFEMEANPDSLPDNYFSDLNENHKYYEDILLAVEYGVVDVGAGYALQPDIPVTRDFAAYTLNFCLGYQLEPGTAYTFTDAAASVHPDSAQIAVNRGWFALSGGKFQPQATVTTAEIKFMLNDATNILEKDIIDPDHEDVFKFQSDVIILADGTEVTEDENSVVTITDCPKTIAAGNKFAAFFGGIPRGYKALSVTKNGNQTVIKTEALSFQDTFADLNMQGVTDANAMEFSPIGDTQIELIEERDSAAFFATKTIPTLSAKTKLKLGSGISVNITAKVKNPRIEYDVTTTRAYVKLVGETEITYEAEAELINEDGESHSVDLCQVGVPGVGGFKLSAAFELAGSVSGTVKGTLVSGIECTYGENIRAVKNFSQTECSSHAEATASVGLKASLGINDMPILTAEIYAEVGFKAQVQITNYGTGTPRSCSQYAGYLYAEYGADASVEFFTWEKSLKVNYDIFDDSNSPVRLVYHYEDGKQVATCAKGSDTSGSAGNFGSGGGSWGYYTNSDSRWSGNGWSGADNSYGVNSAGQSVQLYTYSLNENNEAVITKYLGDAWTVYVPRTIDGHTVVGIDYSAFEQKHMTGIYFPNTLKYIKNGAFYTCGNLREVRFPESFETLYCGAFENCKALRSVYITKNMRAEDYCGANYKYPGPFVGCENLTNIEFEAGITRIPHALFINCPGLEKVTIPNTVTSIETQAFSECDNLQSVVLPNSLVTIDNYAFSGCDFLWDITLPASLKTLGCGALQYCNSLESINIPKDIATGEHCGSNYQYPGPFTGCENLSSIEFASGITQLPNGLLSGCPGLKSITVPNTVTKIGFKAFADSVNLESVTLSNALTFIDAYTFAGCTSLKEANLPASVKTLGCGAFQNCTSLKKVHIPTDMETGTHCGNNAYPGPFNGCSSLTDVTFGSGFSTMPNGLFWNCTGLESIVLPDRVKNISWKAFSDCTNLKSISIPNSVTSIADNAFYKSGLETVTIPSSVTSIGSRAFQMSQLRTVTIPDSVTTVGDHVLADCPELKSITWSAGATTIKDYSFAGSVKVETINLPNTVKTLNKGIFRDCDALKTMVLPNSITSIGNELFYGCDSLVQVVIPNSVATMGTSGFENCKVLTSVTLSNKLKNIPNNTFRSCAQLKEIVVPASVTSIGDNAFASSPILQKVYLPRTLTSISGSAFSYKDTTTLYGVPGSFGETWANSNGFQFVSHEVHATKAELTKTDLTLLKGKTEYLVLNITPLEMNDQIAYTSANTSVATVSAEGLVTAKATGSTTITATVGDISVTCQITVRQPVTGISLNNTSLSLEMLNTFQLTATVKPTNAYDSTVTWTTSDPSVATVTQDGLITAVNIGKATITVTANDGSGCSKSCTVTVTEPVLRNGWISENSNRYYYQNGAKTTGWKYIDGAYYYFNTNGVMQTGWLKDQGTWYYLRSSGAMATGWVQDGSNWYFMDGSGAMVANQWRKDSKGWCWLTASGAMATNAWVKDSKGWCYIGADGYCLTNCWAKDSYGWIWLDSEGSMTKNQWISDGGKWYYVDSNGYMVTGWLQQGSAWYYLKAYGDMATGWQQIGGSWYYFKSSGEMATGWLKVGGTWYYFKSFGAMQTGWLKDGNTWYYFHSSGAMATGSAKIGNKSYRFNASGACLNP